MTEKQLFDRVFFEKEASEKLRSYVKIWKKNALQVIVLVDTNTQKHCAPYLYTFFDEATYVYSEIVIPTGESAKNIETLIQIWNFLIEIQADRSAVLINLGGGVVSDIGGFAASCFKRGITFINIPTTLLAMIDAAIGGKNGINFQGNKNLIGTFAQADSVLIFKSFLKTLPEEETRAAIGEILKYAFVAKPEILTVFENKNIDLQDFLSLIESCIQIKQQIIANDFFDQGDRKVLNFGHTVGHAFEAWALENNKILHHGEAVAFGILISLWLSEKYCKLESTYSKWYKAVLETHFTPFQIPVYQIEIIINWIRNDKKNTSGKFNFVLIQMPGIPKIDVAVSEDDLRDVLTRFSSYF
ncbi:MAG: 3-dehydroquinate synthase [Lentimicrobiaceae bacterium]|jgi:3-dehydroquinate synthase|nr:3-dehydroquinate synthase [Lentimicrobiaceae bacterium]